MNSELDDQKFEAYLREFTLKAPQPLRIPRSARNRRWLLAVAAAVVLAAALAWIARRNPPSSRKNLASRSQDLLRPASLGSLSRVARDNPDDLDRELDSLGSQVLPDVQHSDGVLHRLAHP